MTLDLAGRKVLYVEDEESDVLFMERAFQQTGLGGMLVSVGDGQQAIEYLSGTGTFSDRNQYPVPGLILLDLNLPLVSGFELLAWIRARAEFSRLPVVVFSSSSRLDDRSRAAELGANDYIEKPNSALKFVDVIPKLKERWLGDAGYA